MYLCYNRYMIDFSWAPEDIRESLLYRKGRLAASCEVCGSVRAMKGPFWVKKLVAEGKSDTVRLCKYHNPNQKICFTRAEVAEWPLGQKKCTRCFSIKPLEEFNKSRPGLFGRMNICKTCRIPDNRIKYLKRTPEYILFHAAKYRAKELNREFTITIEDIVIPDICPVFGIPLVKIAGERDSSPSLDRIDSSKGYTPDNIQVMSWRANTLKNNMTAEESILLAKFLNCDVVDLVKTR